MINSYVEEGFEIGNEQREIKNIIENRNIFEDNKSISRIYTEGAAHKENDNEQNEKKGVNEPSFLIELKESLKNEDRKSPQLAKRKKQSRI